MSKLLVTCTAILLFGLSCYGITKLEQRFEERWLMFLFFSIFSLSSFFSLRWLLPDDCYLAKWFDDQREFFK